MQRFVRDIIKPEIARHLQETDKFAYIMQNGYGTRKPHSTEWERFCEFPVVKHVVRKKNHVFVDYFRYFVLTPTSFVVVSIRKQSLLDLLEDANLIKAKHSRLLALFLSDRKTLERAQLLKRESPLTTVLLTNMLTMEVL